MPATSTDRLQQKYVEVYREIARCREGDGIQVRTYGASLDVIVTSVHAGDSADIREAYLTGRVLSVPVEVKVTAHNLAAGFYWMRAVERAA